MRNRHNKASPNPRRNSDFVSDSFSSTSQPDSRDSFLYARDENRYITNEYREMEKSGYVPVYHSPDDPYLSTSVRESIQEAETYTRNSLEEQHPPDFLPTYLDSSSDSESNASEFPVSLTGISHRDFHGEVFEKERQEGVLMHIVDVQPDGNCLFYCYTSILESICPTVTPFKLRTQVSESITESQFLDLHSIYTFAKRENDLEMMNDLLHMENIHSLEDLKEVIKTPMYFGDELAVEAINKLYGIRTIIVCRTDEEVISVNNKWKRKNADAETTEEVLQKLETENIRYCILLLDTITQHYKFAVYDQRTLIPFRDLPPDLKHTFF